MAEVLAALQKLTHNYVKAIETLDVEQQIAPRLPDCIQQVSPKSLGHPPTDNAGFRRSVERVFPNLKNFTFTVGHITTDAESRRVVIQGSGRADTVVGPYVNDFVFVLHATEDGTRLKMVEEFLDSAAITEWGRKLKAFHEANTPSA
ncbi:hypothetical protein MMC07_008258 [Pseudocyphellaria aurata]|nr:hypothetical protein [Pseudocyphellaria aurata]